MAEYEFTVETENPTPYIEHKKHAWGKPAEAQYTEKASGVLVIKNPRDIEVEALKRGLFAPDQYQLIARLQGESPDMKNQVPVSFDKHERVQKLSEIDEGTFSSPATLRRRGHFFLDRHGYIVSAHGALTKPTIVSFAANLIGVRNLMLDNILEEYRKAGRPDETHFEEVALAADNMSQEILEEVEPKLVAVHGLTMAILQEKLTLFQQ